MENEEFTLVAVKMLKDEATEDLRADFEREACVLAEFSHPNIVRLLGVCAIGSPMCLLFEFMGRGDLRNFLRSCSPSNYNTITRDSQGELFEDRKLCASDLTAISRQIAAGMVYLSERQFVHRDLACRNCLIGDDLVVKIADFGLSQKLFQNDVYRGDENDAIPIRWLPLESILYKKFTIQSDVWSFGILMWEVFSFAAQPYQGMSHTQLVEFLESGQRLHIPESTPQYIYNIMIQCWQDSPMDRPSFTFILKRLEQKESQLSLASASSFTSNLKLHS